MGRHYRGKHRLVTPHSGRNRVGVMTAVLASGLIAGGLLMPAAPAQPVALQAYTAPLLSNPPVHHDNDRNHGRRGSIHFRGPIRRGHWDNVCGPHRVWSPRLHRTIVLHSCHRTWRNW